MISKMRKSIASFYIGLTQSPVWRWDKHGANSEQHPDMVEHSIRYDKMYVLFCDTAPGAARLERHLIARLGKDCRCASKSSGGERAYGDVLTFVYMIVGSFETVHRLALADRS